MLIKISTILLPSILLSVVSSKSPFLDSYLRKRRSIINKDKSKIIGNDVRLNRNEIKVNRILMQMKKEEIEAAMNKPDKFMPTHFITARKEIIKFKVFQFIKKIPKGASVFSRLPGMASEDFIYRITYAAEKFLYARKNGDGHIDMRFSKKPPPGDWGLLDQLRKNEDFEESLKESVSLIVEHPESRYKNESIVWNKYRKVFETVSNLILYKPILQQYTMQVLKELYEDNVLYLEMRSDFKNMYNYEQCIYTEEEFLQTILVTLWKFRSEHPEFQGLRFIYSPGPIKDNQTLIGYIQKYKSLKKTFSNYIAAFELVFEGDEGTPLVDFVGTLLEYCRGCDFYFRGGQTKWFGTPFDYNVLDAILLNSKRLTQSYSITKHPKLMGLVKNRKIPVDVCPISHQIFGFFKDARNNPMVQLISEDHAVVVCNDSPGFWGAEALSFDWYYVFMGMSSKEADLKLLKKLAWNSLQYSSLSGQWKSIAFKTWQRKWDDFILEASKNITLT